MHRHPGREKSRTGLHRPPGALSFAVQRNDHGFFAPLGPEDVQDPPRARAAGPMLDEHPDTVGPRLFDHRRDIEAVAGL